jgi:fructan beta-fructosidase
MNDPNGMVYYQGEYHLFYQHYPDSTVWGPMHWGHAVSLDLVHWEHLPIALYPDALGMIFSGSAVVDYQNTSGFGSKENPPMVAIFTYHDMAGEKAGRTDFQTQGIAYSLDRGRSWTKYKNNPVLANPGITDFRDPKVIWHKESKQWIMALAVYDHIRFYGSPNLLDWQLLSSFGAGIGAHGGVWECPDLFTLRVDETGEEKWVLLVSINPGGPNGGSATQYFIGNFDGRRFVLDQPFLQSLTEASAIPQGILFADFEGENYTLWKTEGRAFGKGPARGAYFGQERVNNYVGKGLANSFSPEGPATGSLISSSFTIRSPSINLMVGGQQDEQSTAVQLLVNNEVVRSATGNNSESLEWVSWDVQELKGKNAVIRILDRSTDPKGHILVDHIVFSGAPVDNSKQDGIFLDYGTDNYAGVTWFGVPQEDGRRLFIGWMSNWNYGQEVPTKTWRSAMTLPRSLHLENTDVGIRLSSRPLRELEVLQHDSYTLEPQTYKKPLDISELLHFSTPTLELQLELEVLSPASDFVLEFSNSKNQRLLLGYDAGRGEYYVDRREAGKHAFSESFGGIHYAPRLVTDKTMELHIYVDVSSIELFADGGKSVMTEIFFPDEPFTRLRLLPGQGGIRVRAGTITELNSIWNPNN